MADSADGKMMAAAPPDAQTHAVMQTHALMQRFNAQNCNKPQIQPSSAPQPTGRTHATQIQPCSGAPPHMACPPNPPTQTTQKPGPTPNGVNPGFCFKPAG